MKKIFAIMLVLVSVFSLVACGQKNEESVEDILASIEPTLGAGYDNPEASFDPNYNYHSIPENFEIVSHDECGIAIDKPYVFSIIDDNHRDRYDYYTIIYREDGAADIYINDVYFYTTMGGVYQYGKGVIFDIVTGNTTHIKSENEIVFSKYGIDYIGVRNDNKAFFTNDPSFDDKYICVKGEVTYAYQFKEDYTVDYYENDTLIETLPYYHGDFAVGLRGSVYCISSDKVALFIGDDVFTLGGVEYEIPPRVVEYPAE